MPKSASLPRRLAGLASLALLTLAGCDAADPEGLTVSGTVTNSFGRPVPGATVSFDARDETDATYVSATTDADGRFSAEVPAGSYTFVAAADGYNPAGRTVAIEGEDVFDQTVSGAGTLQAQFVSALTGQGARDVTIRCVRARADGGFPDLAVAYDFEATTGAEGSLQVVGAPAGPLRCHAEGPDYEARLFDVTVRRDGPTAIPPFVVTPPPPEGALRIVLTWNSDPRDLDSHLSGPDSDGGRFHLYFASRTYGQSLLDLDDTDSFGPETITVFAPADGTFRYSVHNWSNQGPEGGQEIAASPARVEVHDHLGLVCTYLAPPPVQAGNTWRVFEVESRPDGAGFALAAPCARGATDLPGLGYVSANGADDLSGFRLGAPTKP